MPVAVRAYIAHSPSGVEHVVAAPYLDGRPAPVWDGLDVRHVEWDTASALRSLGSLRHLLRVVHHDVVHAHSSFPGAYARVLRSPRRTRLVYTPHCFGFLRADVSVPARAAYRLIERLLGPRTSVLAACGPGEKAEALRLGIPEHRIVVVPNIASLPTASSDQVRPDPGEIGRLRVGMLGRWAPQKDPRFFEDRVAELSAALPEVRVEGWWIGGSENTREQIEPEGFVRRTGWLASAHVEERLRDLDVYVHSAAWEGFPIAILDARAVGLPMLCRRIAAVPGLPAALSIEGGLPSLVEAVRGGRFVEWSRKNREGWDSYLGDRRPAAQRSALDLAWGRTVSDRAAL